jgi:hypothetical protein
MKKLRITERQYKAILDHSSSTRIDESQLLNEGSKELILGAAIIIAMAIGKDLSNYNKVVANRAVSDPSIMGKIKTTFEDETSLKELTDEFTNVGMKNPSVLLAKNAQAVVDEYNRIARSKGMSHELDVDAINNLKALNPPKKS